MKNNAGLASVLHSLSLWAAPKGSVRAGGAEEVLICYIADSGRSTVTSAANMLSGSLLPPHDLHVLNVSGRPTKDNHLMQRLKSSNFVCFPRGKTVIACSFPGFPWTINDGKWWIAALNHRQPRLRSFIRLTCAWPFGSRCQTNVLARRLSFALFVFLTTAVLTLSAQSNRQDGKGGRAARSGENTRTLTSGMSGLLSPHLS